MIDRLLLALFLLLPVHAAAVEEQKTAEKKIFDTLTVYWENDAFAGEDGGYTNGIKFTWSTPYAINHEGSHLPKWSHPLINSLPFVKDPETRRAVSLSFGQNIYTPEDTEHSNLIVYDRPYGGITYLSASFNSRTAWQKNSWEFLLGIVGPLSFAEEVQRWSHDLLGSKRTNGWDHQLGNELGIELVYERQWLLFHTDSEQVGVGYDLIPHLGARLGNIRTYINSGLEIRFGWNLPQNFGSCPIRAGCDSNSAFNDGPSRPTKGGLTGIHLFTAVDVRAVAHDIFLDGNTFKDSHSVEREVLVADLMSGFAVEYNNIKTTWSYIYQTKQFKTQKDQQIFGALSVSWVY